MALTRSSSTTPRGKSTAAASRDNENSSSIVSPSTKKKYTPEYKQFLRERAHSTVADSGKTNTITSPLTKSTAASKADATKQENIATPKKLDQISHTSSTSTSPAKMMETENDRTRDRDRARVVMPTPQNTPSNQQKKVQPTSKSVSWNDDENDEQKKASNDVKQVSKKFPSVKIAEKAAVTSTKTDVQDLEKKFDSLQLAGNSKTTNAIASAKEASNQKVKPVTKVPELKGIAKWLLDDLQGNDPKLVLQALANVWTSVCTRQTTVGIRLLIKSSTEEHDLLGTAAILVQTMQKWRDHLTILHNACGFLASYAVASPRGTASLIKCGAIEAIVNAMERFPANENMQNVCSKALMTLSYDPDNDQPLTSKELCAAWHSFLFDYDGVSILVASLQVCENVPDCLANCACLLFNLIHLDSATKADVKSKIRKSGAQIILFQAMQKHHHHERLHKNGAKFIREF